MTVTYEHPQHDMSIAASDDGYAWLVFGADLSAAVAVSTGCLPDCIPTDGDIIRAGGRLYSVGLMDTSDPPLLHLTSDVPDCGLWWDADEDAAG